MFDVSRCNFPLQPAWLQPVHGPDLTRLASCPSPRSGLQGTIGYICQGYPSTHMLRFPKDKKPEPKLRESGSTACLGEPKQPICWLLHLALSCRRIYLLECVCQILRRGLHHFLIQVRVDVRCGLVFVVSHDLHCFQRVHPSSVKHSYEIVAEVVRRQRVLPQVYGIIGPTQLCALFMLHG